MREVYKLIGRITPRDVNVLITGERGTGKELIARAALHHSPRKEQARNMAGFLTDLSQDLNVPAVAVGQKQPLVSDPKFTHWVVEQGQIIGEAHSVEPADDGQSFAFVRLFAMPEMAEYGYIESVKLCSKVDASQT